MNALLSFFLSCFSFPPLFAWPLEFGLGTRSPCFFAWPLELGLGTHNPRSVAWPPELGLGTHNPRFVVWPLELGLGTHNPRFLAWPLELGLGTHSPCFFAWPLEFGLGTLILFLFVGNHLMCVQCLGISFRRQCNPFETMWCTPCVGQRRRIFGDRPGHPRNGA